MLTLNKKAISAIVALTLLLAVSVGAYFLVDEWVLELSKDFQTDYKVQNKNAMYRTEIQGLEGDKLYFKNTLGQNLTILDVKVGNISCGITGDLEKGFQSINLSNCYENVSRGVNEFVIITNQGVFTKTYYLGSSILGTPQIPTLVGNYFTYLAGPMSVNGFSYDNDSILSNVVFNDSVNGIVLDREVKKGFVSVLSGSADDIAKSVIQTSDGGFVVSGYGNSYGGGDGDIYLSKFDNNGIEQWTKSFGGTSGDSNYAVVQTSDGGYAIAGCGTSFGNSDLDVYLSKFDSNGIEQWTKMFGDSVHDCAYSLTETSDESLVLAGFTGSYGSSDYDILLSKFNNEGVEQWTNYVGGGSNDAAYSITETSDNGFIVTGYASSYAGNNDVFLIKYNSAGVEQWTKTLGGSAADGGFDVIESYDGGFVVVGYTQSYGGSDYDLILSKFNNNGVEQWTKILGGSSNDLGRSLIEDDLGNLYVVGNTQSYGGSDVDILLSKFNSNGIEQWSKAIGGSGDDSGEDIIRFGNDFLLVGASKSYDGADSDFLSVRFDSDGNVDSFTDILNLDISEVNEVVSEVDRTVSEVDISATVTNLDILESDEDVTSTQIYNYSSNNYYEQGTYTSKIFDAGSLANWKEINLESKSLGADKPSTFLTILDGTGSDFGKEVILANDSGYIVGGYIGSFGGSDMDVMISKFNENGQEVWTKLIGGNSNDHGHGIINTVDGGYVIAGNIVSYGSSNNDIGLFKFDSNGIEQWSITLDGSQHDYFTKMILLNNGDILVTGITTSYGGVDQDILLSRINSNGVEQWTKIIGSTSNDGGVGIYETSTGEILLTGRTESYVSGTGLILIKFNSDGVEQWTKTVGGSSGQYDIGKAIYELDDGSIIVGGYGNSYGAGNFDIYLSKFNSDGVEQWTKTIGGSALDYFYSFTNTFDNNFVIVGTTQSYGGSDTDILIIKVNINGSILWSKVIGGTLADSAYSIVEDKENNLVITGNSQSYGGSDNDILLIKLNKNGDIENFADINSLDINSVEQNVIEVNQNIVETNIVLSQTYHTITESNEEVSFLSEIFNPSDLSINVNVRSCDDSNCQGESWKTLSSNIINENNRYFQYMLNLTTADLTKTPEVYNVTIDYIDSPSIIKFVNPTPVNNLITTNRNHLINVSINLSEINNVSFTWNGVRENLVVSDAQLSLIPSYSGDDFGYDIIATKNDTYVVVGKTQSNGAFVSKYHNNGTKIWTKLVGSSGYSFYGVDEDNFGNLYLGGSTASSTSSLIVKLNSEGSLQWSKTFGNKANSEWFYDVLVSSDNYVYVGGATAIIASSQYDPILAKFDLDGNQIWIKNFNAAGNDYFNELVENEDKNLSLVWMSAGLGNGWQGILSKVQPDGTVLWNKIFGGTGADYAWTHIQTNDGNYLVGGGTASYGGTSDWDMFLAKINNSGSLMWSKIVDESTKSVIRDLVELDNRNIIVVAEGEDSGAKGNIIIAKFDSLGNEIWSEELNNSLAENPYGVDKLSDGNIVLTGYRESSSKDILNLKLSSNGNILNYSDYVRKEVSSSDISLNFENLAFSLNTISGSFSNIGASVVNSNPTINVLYEQNSQLKGTYPNQYFEVEKNNLNQGTHIFSAEVCSISSCYQTETRSLTIQREDFVDNSLLFDGVDDYLSWTPSSEGNRKTWTWSGWVKFGSLGEPGIFGTKIDDNNREYITLYHDSGKYYIQYLQRIGGINIGLVLVEGSLNDFSDWYHIVVEKNTDETVSQDRIKIYLNGKRQNIGSSIIAPIYQTQGDNSGILNSIQNHNIGNIYNNYNGYLSEVNFIDGKALTPDYFGEFNNYGKWLPKKYSGDYGQNGFYLNFNNSGSLGEDSSGNNNDFANNGGLVQTIDTPENNFAILDINNKGPYATISQNNLRGTISQGDDRVKGTLGIEIATGGKYYFETKVISNNYLAFGVGTEKVPSDGISNGDPSKIVIHYGGGLYLQNGTTTTLQSGITCNNGEVFGFALNLDDNLISVYRNGGLVASDISLNYSQLNGDYLLPFVEITSGAARTPNAAAQFNFGSVSFDYSIPTGYKTLSSKNLQAPTVNPKEGFNLLNYSGTGATQSINDLDFSPDLVWLKRVDAVAEHQLYDSVRGANNRLFSSNTNGQASATDTLMSFDSNGFTLGDDAVVQGINYNGGDFVAWNWKESPEYGFDIVNYTGNGIAGRKISHNLGKKPTFMIVKALDILEPWNIYHTDLGATKFLRFDTATPMTADYMWNDMEPNSTHFILGSNSGTNWVSGGEYIAYLFTSIPGFSKIGSYTGNGNVDGPFIYTGFKPKFVMVKSSTYARGWGMNTYNYIGGNNVPSWVWADTTHAEDRNWQMDFLSNGFKLRKTDAWSNLNGETYIYMAFAESPLSTNE